MGLAAAQSKARQRVTPRLPKHTQHTPRRAPPILSLLACIRTPAPVSALTMRPRTKATGGGGAHSTWGEVRPVNGS